MADKEIREHAGTLFPRIKNYTTEELYRTSPLKQCMDCQNWQGFNGCRLYPQVSKEKPKETDEGTCLYRKTGN